MSTATAKPPKPLRRAVGAVVIPAERFEAWHAMASAVPGLNVVELGVLSAVAEHFRQLAARGYGMTLSYDRLGHHLDVDPIHVKWAVYRLLEIGLVGVTKRGNVRSHAYAMTLPRRLVAAMAAAAADDAPPF